MICIVTPHAKSQFRKRLGLKDEVAQLYFENAVAIAGNLDRPARISFCGVTFVTKPGRVQGEIVAVTAWPCMTLKYSLLNAGSSAA